MRRQHGEARRANHRRRHVPREQGDDPHRLYQGPRDRLNFSRGNFQAFAPCLELVASGKIDPDLYISHRFPLSRAEDALKLLEARNVEAHKIVLHPQAGA